MAVIEYELCRIFEKKIFLTACVQDNATLPGQARPPPGVSEERCASCRGVGSASGTKVPT